LTHKKKEVKSYTGTLKEQILNTYLLKDVYFL